MRAGPAGRAREARRRGQVPPARRQVVARGTGSARRARGRWARTSAVRSARLPRLPTTPGFDRAPRIPAISAFDRSVRLLCDGRRDREHEGREDCGRQAARPLAGLERSSKSSMTRSSPSEADLRRRSARSRSERGIQRLGPAAGRTSRRQPALVGSAPAPSVRGRRCQDEGTAWRAVRGRRRTRVLRRMGARPAPVELPPPGQPPNGSDAARCRPPPRRRPVMRPRSPTKSRAAQSRSDHPGRRRPRCARPAPARPTRPRRAPPEPRHIARGGRTRPPAPSS